MRHLLRISVLVLFFSVGVAAFEANRLLDANSEFSGSDDTTNTLNLTSIPPRIQSCPLNLTTDHCGLATYDFDLINPQTGLRPGIFTLVSGPGTIETYTGKWSYSPTIADVGYATIVIAAQDSITLEQVSPCTVPLVFTNAAPTFTSGCNLFKLAVTGYPVVIDFNASSGDCDPLTFDLVGVTPAPLGSYSLNASTGLLTFVPDISEGPTTFTFEVCVRDGVSESCCSAMIEMLCCGTKPVCGNIDGSDPPTINILDVTYLVNYLFKHGQSPIPTTGVADLNCDPDLKVNILDLTYMVKYLFGGGDSPCNGCPR